jgi:hypothetical protein
MKLPLLSNLTKAAIAAALTPVAVVADVLTLPASSLDPHRGPFERTEQLLTACGKCIAEAVKPETTSPH